MEEFVWRGMKGEETRPVDMDTARLFYTIRFLWNHSVPTHLRLRPYRHYKLGDAYTWEYRREALRHLCAELASRSEMEAEHREELDIMIVRQVQISPDFDALLRLWGVPQAFAVDSDALL